MNLKSFISSVVLTSMMITVALPSYAANIDVRDQSGYTLAPLHDVTYYNSRGTQINHKKYNTITNMQVQSLDSLCSVFANPSSNTALSKHYDSSDSTTRKCVHTNTSSFAIVVADNSVDSHDVESKLVVKDRSAQIGTADVYKNVTLNFKNGLSVENGNLLFENSFVSRGTGTPDTKNQSMLF